MKTRTFKYLALAAGLTTLARRKERPPLRQPATAPAPHSADRPSVVGYLKKTFSAFFDDDCMTMGAALAYYTVFSLPPLLMLVISITGLVFGREAVQHNIQDQIQGLIGSGAAQQVQTMVESASQNRSAGMIGTAVGILVLLFGATGAFAALQDALNKTWHVKPDPHAGGIKAFIGKRVLSLGMILGVGFLLLVSLSVSAGLAAFGGWVGGLLPAGFSGALLQAAGAVVSFAVITVLFAAILKVLPDAHVEWREVWVGAAITSLLFTIGKTAIGIYIGKSGMGSAYGAAASLVAIVAWLYYASLIVLLGAEFTKIWAAAHGREIRPEEGAVRVVTEERVEAGDREGGG